MGYVIFCYVLIYCTFFGRLSVEKITISLLIIKFRVKWAHFVWSYFYIFLVFLPVFRHFLNILRFFQFLGNCSQNTWKSTFSNIQKLKNLFFIKISSWGKPIFVCDSVIPFEGDYEKKWTNEWSSRFDFIVL